MTEVFSCPTCARPLALGAGRCPGCGTRLILGVQARRAGLFVAVGVAIGILAGGSMTSAWLGAAGDRPGSTMTVPSTGVGTTPSGPSAPPAATPGVVPVAVPAGLTALRQTAALNERLAQGAAALEASLAAATLDAPGVARIIRTINGDAVVGAELAAWVGTWGPAAAVGADLGRAYTDLRAIARDALRAPLRDAVAYRAGAERMLEGLAVLAASDAVARALAASVAPPVGATP